MSNEYDYSGLYNNTSGSGQPNGQNPQPEQSAPAQNQQPQQSSYPNVGSSGVNTANTARTDYSSCNSGSTSGQNPQQGVAEAGHQTDKRQQLQRRQWQ